MVENTCKNSVIHRNLLADSDFLNFVAVVEKLINSGQIHVCRNQTSENRVEELVGILFIAYSFRTRSISDSITDALLGSVFKTIDRHMLYSIRRAQFLPLRTGEDSIYPQWHLRSFESENHGDLTPVRLATEAW